MNPRFQIDELVTQDSRGVVFQGVDQETGQHVAMRRFLPSGGESLGLNAAKQEDYRKAVAIMKEVSHPCLREVLDGGCDAVDGMPYLVTRWTDGDMLRDWMAARGGLQQDMARYVISRLLDVCIALSTAFGRDALWVETALESVIASEENGEGAMPGISFWVCPWRWFGAKKGDDDWRAGVADFAEALLGGPGRAGADPRNASLLVWVQRIRHKEISCLKAAFAALKVPVDDKETAAATRLLSAPPEPAAPFAAASRPASALTLPQPSRGNVRLPSQSGGGTGRMIAIAACVLALLGGAAWWFSRPPAVAVADATVTAAADAPDVSIPANRRQAVVDGMMSQIQNENAMADERRQSIEKRGYYTVREADLLLEKNGREVSLRGRLANVRFSGSGLTMYLEFSSDPPREEPRAYAMRRDLADGIREEDLKPLVGKLIEIRGPVEIETVARTRRARVSLISRERLTVLPDEADYDVR
jgi:hypothetical protein